MRRPFWLRAFASSLFNSAFGLRASDFLRVSGLGFRTSLSPPWLLGKVEQLNQGLKMPDLILIWGSERKDRGGARLFGPK
jgi:hypothetical protein